MPSDDVPAPRGKDEPQIDSSVPHSARVFNYLLGGKDYYPADQAAGDLYREHWPDLAAEVRVSRYFLTRVVRYLAGEANIRQFLDIGTGLPTMDNTHEVAQGVAPESKIVYVDNDPLVLVHARALLTSTPEGETAYIDADVRDPENILRQAAETLDFSEPTAVILMGILGLVEDYDEARSIVRRLLDTLPSGSYLALRDGTDIDEMINEANRIYNQSGAPPYILRTPQQIEAYFEGLELVEPGVVLLTHWRPELAQVSEVARLSGYGGVGRKP